METDIKINLLPWREELREQRKKEFVQVLLVVLMIAGVIIFGFDRFYKSEIDTQNARNNYLKGDISDLEKKIAEIKTLQQQRTQLLARMQVIQDLQGNRPIIVRVFDELARRLADRVFFTSVQLKGKDMEIKGVAESNNRISSQLRNFSESDWFDKPNVTEITADPSYGPTASRFTMSVEQTAPKKDEEK
ncbi:MAG TPA: PilN domain-containing protein [Pseudomonadales bacterium]|nr:PilN domain-containing protein [Pseudomonadales bacterium]